MSLSLTLPTATLSFSLTKSVSFSMTLPTATASHSLSSSLSLSFSATHSSSISPTFSKSRSFTFTLPTLTPSYTDTLSLSLPTMTTTATMTVTRSETMSITSTYTLPTYTSTETITLPTFTSSASAENPYYTYALLRTNARCDGPKRSLGWAKNAGECAKSCARESACRFFIFGHHSEKFKNEANKCYMELTNGATTADPCADAASSVGLQRAGHSLGRDASALGYVQDAYDLYEVVREEGYCAGSGEYAWGQLTVDDRRLSSRFDVHDCGNQDNCFDGRKSWVAGTECSQACMTQNETAPHLLMQFRDPVQLTSLFVYPNPHETRYLQDGYLVYTAQRIYGTDGWVLCSNRSVTTVGTEYYHDSCIASDVRAVKIELPGANRQLAMLEVLAYGCKQNLTIADNIWRGQTIQDTARVDRTSHGGWCSDNRHDDACQVPVGTMCLGGLLRDWNDELATPTWSFCGDFGTCLALGDSPLPTSTCVCTRGYELRFIGKHHVTCTLAGTYPGYKKFINQTLI